MPRTPPLPPELWDQIPPVIQSLLLLIIEGYERRITALEREVAVLKEQAQRNSQNSSKPQSSDGPHVKRKPPQAPSGRKRGGQPGHPLHRRTWIPVERCLTHLNSRGRQIRPAKSKPSSLWDRRCVVLASSFMPDRLRFRLWSLAWHSLVSAILPDHPPEIAGL
jgi:hypothetical protein